MKIHVNRKVEQICNEFQFRYTLKSVKQDLNLGILIIPLPIEDLYVNIFEKAKIFFIIQ